MVLQEVISSSIHAVGYDPTAKTLQVQFKTGSIYEYLDVPMEVYETLMSISASGESIGKYFNQNIKNLYTYQKMS